MRSFVVWATAFRAFMLNNQGILFISHDIVDAEKQLREGVLSMCLFSRIHERHSHHRLYIGKDFLTQ